MPYDLNDPNLDFAGQADILARVLKRGQALRQTPTNEMAGTSGIRAMSGADPGAFLSRAAGIIDQRRAEEGQTALNAEENRRYRGLAQAMAQTGTKEVPRFTKALNPEGAPLGLIDQNSEEQMTVPLNPIEENNRRMGIATEMTMLPQAKAVGNMYLQQGAAFPEKIAQLKEKAETSLKELGMRLEDKGLDRNVRIQLAQQMDDTKRYLGELNASTQRMVAGMHQATQRAIAGNNPDGKPLTQGETKAIMEANDMATELRQLGTTFTDDKAGYGALGDTARKAAGILGSWAPKDVQDTNAWWAAYEQLSELPTRNKIFGAALTVPETVLWNQARMIKPGADPAEVRKAVTHMTGIMQSKADRLGASAVAGGKSPAAVEAITGKNPTTGASTGTPVKRYNPATGRLE